MTLRLVGLRAGSNGTVLAELDPGTHEGRVHAKFDLDRGGAVVVASPEPDVFAGFAASIEEVRQITSAVIAFSAASQELVKE